MYHIHHGDCREILPTLNRQYHACICDPPYNLTSHRETSSIRADCNSPHGRVQKGFMGKTWDSAVAFDPDTWRAILDRLLPGAHLIAFGGPRTHHRLMCAIEDAGFEIRDCLMWVFGTGFPKSHDVSKAIDKHLGAPTTPEAQHWDGWGSALKPAYEPIILARKPLDGTLAQNTLKHGVGGLNIDKCRIATDDSWVCKVSGEKRESIYTHEGAKQATSKADSMMRFRTVSHNHSDGRFPPNLIHDGSDEVLDLFPQTQSTAQPRHNKARPASAAKGSDSAHVAYGYADQGSAARFFYCSKASKAEREMGLDKKLASFQELLSETSTARANNHPTVKPLKLMSYLCQLITPPNGHILDPFAGSGSTGAAAVQEGFDFTGIELEAEYVEIAERRIASVV